MDEVCPRGVFAPAGTLTATPRYPLTLPSPPTREREMGNRGRWGEAPSSPDLFCPSPFGEGLGRGGATFAENMGAKAAEFETFSRQS